MLILKQGSIFPFLFCPVFFFLFDRGWFDNSSEAFEKIELSDIFVWYNLSTVYSVNGFIIHICQLFVDHKKTSILSKTTKNWF